jgi:hypothetical protein
VRLNGRRLAGLSFALKWWEGEWRGNFGQDMLDKNVVLLGTHLGTYGTSWELDGNTLGVEKNSKNLPPQPKRKEISPFYLC